MNIYFETLYLKGILSDGTIIAVKQLSSRSKQGNREFVNEIGMISAVQHANLVRLYGCCTEGNQLCLVYEYMENNCLARTLFGELTVTCLCHIKIRSFLQISESYNGTSKDMVPSIV